MFYKGIKRFFVLVGVFVLASVVFAGCKDDKTTKLTSIGFKETEAITLVLGNTYQPQVVLTPSYADNLDYYFETSSNSNVITIINKSIKAVGEGVAQLKVVSAENSNLNDIISVKVIPETIKLSAPKNLTFNGSSYSFDYQTMAEKYIVNVNGVAFDIGTRNSLSLEEIAVSVPNVYNTVLSAKVQAVGDGNITETSQFSEELKVLKIGSVENLNVEENILSFSKLAGVKFYEVSLLKGGDKIETVIVDASNFETLIEVDLLDVLSDIEGDCNLVIKSMQEDYETEEGVTVYSSNETNINLMVVGKVENLTIHQYSLHWDSVLGADSYNLYDKDGKLLKSNIENNELNILDLVSDAGRYNFKIKPVSNRLNNVVNLDEFSETIEFEILEAPTVSFGEQTINWSVVDNAIGYNLKVVDSKNVVRYNQLLVANSFNVYSLNTTGEYSFELSSIGNGVDYISSIDVVKGSFKLLNAVENLSISNRLVSWDGDANGGYKITIKQGDEVIKTDLASQRSFDLSGENFYAGDYTLTVQGLGITSVVNGETATFNSTEKQIAFTQLADIDPTTLTVKEDNNEFNINFEIDAKTATVTGLSIERLSKISNTKYSFEPSDLNIGDNHFSFKAIGNGREIFDSKNAVAITLTKLASPTSIANSSNILSVNPVNNAMGYKLFVNNTEQELPYDITGLTAGEYVFTAQAIGYIDDPSKTYIINSDISSRLYRVLKLDAPTITFDKNSLSFKVDANGVSSNLYDYNFTLASGAKTETVIVSNGVANCASLMAEEGEYTATVYLKAKEDSNYDVVLDSASVSLTVHRVAGSSISMELVQNQNNSESLKINCGQTIEDGYTIKLKVNDANEIELNSSNNYSVDLINENYGANPIFANSGTYTISASLAPSDTNKLESKEITLGTLTKLSQVSNIAKDGNNITFDTVSNASSYKLQFNSGSALYYIDLDTNSISIDDLKDKLLSQGFTMLENVNNSVRLVAVGSASNLNVSSISDETFAFKILSTPTAQFQIINEEKSILINNITDATSFKLTATDGTSYFNKDLTNSSGANLALKEITGLSTGEIAVKIKASSTANNIFYSVEQELKYTILDTPVFSVSGGVVTWTFDDNASHYIIYINGNSTTLEIGTENYSLAEGVAKYDLKGLDFSSATIKLQAISNFTNGANYYYDSPISIEQRISKLSSPTILTNSGDVVIQVSSTDVNNIEDIKIIRAYTTEEISVKTLVGEISSSMTIEASKLVEYLSIESIALEEFSIQVIAKADSGYLNSNITNFYLKGLKQVSSLEVKTTVNYTDNIGETIDQIIWTNNSLNTDGVSGYLINILYNEENYTYNVSGGTEISYTFPTNDAFGAGAYEISMKVIATGGGEDNEKAFYWVNSEYCESYTIYLCENATGLTTAQGLVQWKSVEKASSYLVRVYSLSTDADKLIENLIYSNETASTSFDFNSFNLASDSGVYRVSVQALNKSDKTIISSKESEKLEVLRLPEITEFKLYNGNLYVNVHNFASGVKLILTDPTNGKTYEFNSSLTSSVADLEGADIAWSSMDDLQTNLKATAGEDSAYGYNWIEFNAQTLIEGTTTTILDCISAGYKLEIIAMGNSVEATEENRLYTVNSTKVNSDSKISGTEDYQLKNTNDSTLRTVHKLTAPKVEVTERGVVSWSLDSTFDASKFIYFKDDANTGFSNLLIYKVTISAPNSDGTGNQDYIFYCVDNIDLNNLPQGVSFTAYTTAENHTYYGYITYNNYYINILRYIDEESVEQGALKIDFTKDYLYFKTPTGGNAGIKLSAGGNFGVAVSLLGDCSQYLTSNIGNPITITRYDQLSLEINDGTIKWINLASDYDSPVYLVKVKTGEDTYFIYLYDKTIAYTLDDVPEKPTLTDESKNVDDYVYLHPIDFKEENGDFKAYINYTLDTLKADGSFLFGAGDYSVLVTTYYRETTNLQVIKSQSSNEYTIKKLEKPTIQLSGGKLAFKQIYVSNQAISDYEISLTVGENNYLINISKGDYKLDNGYIYWAVPKTITIDEETSIDLSQFTAYEFTFSVRAISNLTDVISSNSSNSFTASMNTAPENVQMTNGTLTWSAVESVSYYEVLVSYTRDGATRTYTATVDTNSFTLPETTITDSAGNGYELTSAMKYKLQVKSVGTTNTISSFYADLLAEDGSLKEVERLKTITSTTIKSKEGELIWESITDINGESLSDIKYIIDFEDDAIEDVELTNQTSYNFADKQAGSYTFTIRASSNDYFTSFASSKVTMYKLPTVNYKNVQITEVDGIPSAISWSASTINNLYADYYLVKIGEDEPITVTPTNATDETITLSFENIDVAGKTIQIRAMSKTTTNLINSDWTSELNFDKAEKIDVSTFVVNGLNFEWREPVGADDSYGYILTYKLDGTTKSQTITAYRLEGEEGNQYKVYYFTPTVVGEYTDIKIVVTKGQGTALASDPVFMQDSEKGGNYVYNFNLFASGAGIEGNPYEINTITHFENIKFFNNAHYKLTADLDYGKKEFTATIIDCEFTGVFDGNEKTISNFTITSSNNKVAIFSSTNGATIKNLTINNATINITANYNGQAYYGAVLVANALTTTFKNVNITNTVMNLSGTSENATSTNSSYYYFGGIAGKLTNSSVTNCNVAIGYNGTEKTSYSTITFKGYSTDYVYFGAVAGHVSDSTISGASDSIADIELYYELHLTGNNSLPAVYIGGVAGYLNGTENDDTYSSLIDYLNVKVYQSAEYTNYATYNAGVVGYIATAKVSNLTVTGQIGTGGETNSAKIGKLVAFVNGNVVLSSNNVDGITLNKGDAVENTLINNQ